jgi:hypothetical protein
METYKEKLKNLKRLEKMVQSLIAGQQVYIKDEAEKDYIQQRIIEINNNLTKVLSQIKEINF